MSQILGEVIARIVPNRGGLLAVTLPRGIGSEIVAAVVGAANERARAGRDTPFAVRVSSTDLHQRQGPTVSPQEIVGYRVGRRLIVWEDGDFDPDKSFSSSVATLIAPSFPDNVSEGTTLGDLAGSIVQTCIDQAKSGTTDGMQRDLEGAVASILIFAKDALQASGNGETSWPLAWWRFVATGAEALTRVLGDRRFAAEAALNAFAAFGLPRPMNGESYSMMDESKYRRAVAADWSSAEDVARSVNRISEDRGTTCLLSALPWESDLHDLMGVSGHPIAALTSIGSWKQRIEGWRDISEEDFIGANGRGRPGAISVSVGEIPCPGPGGDDAPLFILPLPAGTFEEIGEAECRWVLPDVRFVIPWREGEAISGDSDKWALPLLLMAPLKFELLQHRLIGGGLELRGNVILPIGRKGSWPRRPVNVTVESSVRGRNVRGLDEQAGCRLLLPDAWRAPSIFVAWGGRRKSVECRAGGKYAVTAGQIEPIERPGEEKVEVTREVNADIWTVDGRMSDSDNSRLVAPGEGRSDGIVGFDRAGVIRDLQLRDGLRLSPIGSAEPVLSIMVELRETRPWSPLVAAAVGKKPRNPVEAAPVEWRQTLRGSLEELYGAAMLSARQDPPLFPDGLWQVALPTGAGGDMPTTLFGGGAVVWPMSVPASDRKAGVGGTGPSSELLASPELGRFRSAFRNVCVELGAQIEDATTVWPGRCQFAKVPEVAVTEYLEAFVALIERADRDGSRDGFWAAYPFSVFIVDREQVRVVAVLLSPLHPVRLAWLASCERGLRRHTAHAADTQQLAQVVEGWNFPWIGPAAALPGNPAIMAAVPAEAGPENVFVGWSMLVGFDNLGGSRPVVPARAAGFRVPAAAASGLNPSAVISATRDYLRVNPFLSTLAFDLYSHARGARSVELDRAVLAAISEVVGEGGDGRRLQGGARVFDSSSREGASPTWEDVADALGLDGLPSAKLEWRRYSSAAAPSVNLRLVEDAQVTLTRMPGEALGSIPPVPYRRFVIRSGEGGEKIDASLSPDSAKDAFGRALRAVETRQEEPFALHAETSNLLGAADQTADWVITGNAFVEPSSLAASLAESGQVLWEWRPGFLTKPRGADASAGINARAYTTIARIPAALQGAIRSSLQLDEKSSSTLFSELGMRGVGLASLLSMGANHVNGALGFFYAYRLLDGPPRQGRQRLILPIDAVDPVLRSIAQSRESDLTKRADLLVVEIFEGGRRCVVIPIEIRCSRGATTTFPSSTSSEVLEKVSQLRDSMAVLRDALAKVSDREEAAADSLSLAAMATVVEAGLLLTRGAPRGRLAADIMRNVASGTCSMSSRRGLVFWFQELGRGDFDWAPDSPEPNVGCLFASAEPGNREVWHNEPGALVQAVGQAIEWCCEVQAPLSVPQPSTTEARADVLTGGALPSKLDDPQALPPEVPVPLAPSAAVSGPPIRIKVNVGMSAGRMVVWDPDAPNQRLNNAHTVILGSSGSGKTQALLSFLLETARQGVVPLILDFKDDYVDPAFLARIGATLYSAEEGLPVSPLALEPDRISGKINVPQLVYSVAEVMRKVHRLGDQQQAALRQALFATFEAAGISREQRDPVTKFPPFGSLKTHLDAIGNSALSSRLAPLFDLKLFDMAHTSLLQMLRQPSVVRLSQLPSEEVKKVVAEILLRGLYTAILREGHRPFHLMLVVDEAHKIANLEAVKLLMKEARAYGVAVFLSSQQASDFDDFVFANAGSILALKLSETGDSERVARLLVGSKEAGRFADKLRTLPPFQGHWKNDHYPKGIPVDVIPYYKRL